MAHHPCILRPRRLAGWLPVLALLWPLSASASDAHADPSAAVGLYLAVLLMAAKLGGHLARALGQPAVLGELVIGVILGNLGHLGVHGLAPITTDPHVDLLARLGVVLLLFEVGLESTVGQMLKVGVGALLVASAGVVVPFALGWLAAALLLPQASSYVHAFLGATLTATSVGITARVFQDLGRSTSPESRLILGAAVLDDVMGLVILAVVGGVISAADVGTTPSWSGIAWIVVKAGGFLVVSLGLGVWLSPRMFSLASRLNTGGVLLAMGLSFCFVLAYLANAIGLAPIVGAFAAGLLLEDVHYRDFRDRGEHSLEELLAPVTSFLVPVFFVVMGMRTDLATFAQGDVLGLAAALTVVGIVGKLAAGLGVLDKGIRRLTVGIGMIPRGEVGLIFANIGMGLSVAGEPVISKSTFSAVVIMVIVTTMITPPLLTWSMGRGLVPPQPAEPAESTP
ncbi:MAG: cation:proton antiporter [Myxococcota bacterium]